jgi:hypothetical protein
MHFSIDDAVMLPGLHPYPRYGRIAAVEEDGQVRVTHVHCGDPRCAAEHRHGDERWSPTELLAARAYQPRAEWEHGRKSSPNAPIE